MPKIDDRLGPGTLTLGATPDDFSCQVAALALVPSAEEGDATATLCDPTPVAPITTTWTLDGTVLQDFSNPAGFQKWAYDNENTEQPFTFIPNTDTGPPTFTGTVLVEAVQIGGEVAEQVTVDFSWQVKGKPDWATTRSAKATAKAED